MSTTFLVRRRVGDSFLGKQNLKIEDALDLFQSWVKDPGRTGETIIQLVDETTNASTLTLRYSESEGEWKKI